MKQIYNNIQESYCSFEISKLLSELGAKFIPTHEEVFGKIWCRHSPRPSADKDYHLVDLYTINFSHDSEQYDLVSHPHYDAPTHALAIEWIRVNFDIHIEVVSYYNNAKIDKLFYEYGISNKENFYGGLIENAIKRISKDWIKEPQTYNLFETFQEATEAALLYCLQNLIKLKTIPSLL